MGKPGEPRLALTEDQADGVLRLLDKQDGSSQQFGEEVGEAVESCLQEFVHGSPGVGIVSMPRPLTLQQCRSYVVAMSELVGKCLPQDSKGTIVREVRDRGMRLGEGATGRYSDSRSGGSLHTDAPHTLEPRPEYFALFCVRSAKLGGALVFVGVDDLLASWKYDDELLDELGKPFYFDRRDPTVEPPTVQHPILSEQNGKPAISYLREYVDLGHSHPGVRPLSPKQRQALDALDEHLNDPNLQSQVMLAPGDFALVNNRTVLHGRTEFRDWDEDERKRLMYRTWIITDQAG